MKVLALREKFGHMGGHSGYDLLFEKLEQQISQTSVWKQEEVILDDELTIPKWLWDLPFLRIQTGLKSKIGRVVSKKRKILFRKRKFNKLHSSLNQFKTPFYSRNSLLSEMKFVMELNAKKYAIGQFSYLENHFALLGLNATKKRIGNTKLVGTAHQSFSWWDKNGNIDTLNVLDAIVVLSESEKNLWNQRLPQKSYFIPHGSNTDFFSPGGKKFDEFTCVFSGYWNRDFNMLKNVIELTLPEQPKIQFKLILPAYKKNELQWFTDVVGKFSQVEILSNLSDDELRATYRGCHIMVLPLQECTANNAVLEGLSCGLPIVTTQLDSVGSYVNNETGTLVEKSDAMAMSRSILDYYSNSQLLRKKSLHARKEAVEKFDWNVIVKKYMELYSFLI